MVLQQIFNHFDEVVLLTRIRYERGRREKKGYKKEKEKEYRGGERRAEKSQEDGGRNGVGGEVNIFFYNRHVSKEWNKNAQTNQIWRPIMLQQYQFKESEGEEWREDSVTKGDGIVQAFTFPFPFFILLFYM